MTIDFYYMPESGPCRAVLMTARALGVELNVKHIDLKDGEHLKPEFLKINPQHCIPTIVDNGFTLWESRAIITYLVEKYAKDDSLYPKDVKKRALVLQRLFFDATVLYQRFADAYYPFLFSGAALDKDKIHKLEEALNFLNTFLASSEFVAGNTLTVADISVVASINTIQGCKFDVAKYPNVVRWLNKTKSTIPNYEESCAGVKEYKKK